VVTGRQSLCTRFRARHEARGRAVSALGKEDVRRSKDGSHSGEDPDAHCLPQGVPKIDSVQYPWKVVYTLTKTVTSTIGGSTDSENLTASFPSGPGVTPPQPPTPLLPGPYSSNVPLPSSVSRSCPPVGETQLSAGNLTVQSAASGKSFTVPPLTGVSEVQYQLALPSGFISSGEYPISASDGPITFSETLTVPAPIQIQSTFAPGTQISSSQPLTN
jgi:hypothetical protein